MEKPGVRNGGFRPLLHLLPPVRGFSVRLACPELKVPGPSRALLHRSGEAVVSSLLPVHTLDGDPIPSGLQAGLRPLHLAGQPLLQRSLPATPASGLPLAPQHLLHPASSSPAPLGPQLPLHPAHSCSAGPFHRHLCTCSAIDSLTKYVSSAHYVPETVRCWARGLRTERPS